MRKFIKGIPEKQYRKQYRKKHDKLPSSKLRAREYMRSWSKTKKGKINHKRCMQRYYKKLRNRVIYLYSGGTMLCSCGKPIEELHHSNVLDGKKEKEKFKGKSTTLARLYQIKMYGKNTKYIIPLCKECHKNIHKGVN
jgi:hypothetical protein